MNEPFIFSGLIFTVFIGVFLTLGIVDFSDKQKNRLTEKNYLNKFRQ